MSIISGQRRDNCIGRGPHERGNESPPDRAGDDTYFAAIRAELASGGYEAMLYDLLHHDLTGFSVRKFPETPALVEQRVRSLTGPNAWRREVLASGRYTRWVPLTGG